MIINIPMEFLYQEYTGLPGISRIYAVFTRKSNKRECQTPMKNYFNVLPSSTQLSIGNTDIDTHSGSGTIEERGCTRVSKHRRRRIRVQSDICVIFEL